MVTQASGTVALTTSNGDHVTLNSASNGLGVEASFYDFEGDARLSMRFANEVDPLILSFGQKSADLAPAVQAVNAHAVAVNEPVTVDLSRGETEPIHSEWDGTDSCVYWQGNVRVCDHDQNGQENCHDELKTIYGTANFHYVKSGNIYHDELKLTQTTGSAVLDLIDDETSTTSAQTSACYSPERPPRY